MTATAQEGAGGRSESMFVVLKEHHRPEKRGNWLWAGMLQEKIWSYRRGGEKAGCTGSI